MPVAKPHRTDYLSWIRLDVASAIPLAVQLHQQLAWLIASGELHLGDRLPPVREFADHLKINLHTVRAAYHTLEKLGLVSSRPGAGTSVVACDLARLAEANADVPSHTIGVLIPALDNSFYAPFIRGIEDAAEKQPVMLLICDTRDNERLAERFFHQLIARQVDGIILASVGFLFGQKVLQAFPYSVYVDVPETDQNSIQLDSRQAGYLATRHLIEHGHTRIGLVSAPLDWSNVRLPYLGYLDALQEANLEHDPQWVVETPGFSVDYGELAAHRLFKAKPEISAVFGSGDLLAIGVMRAVQASGRVVPDDVAIVGFNNIDLAEFVNPGLTTVSVPMYEIGVKAFRLIQQVRSRKKPIQKPLVFSPRLIVRQSCGCKPAWGT